MAHTCHSRTTFVSLTSQVASMRVLAWYLSARLHSLPSLPVLACVNWQCFLFDGTSSEVFKMCTPSSSKWALMSKPFLDRIITLHRLSIAILVIVPREHSLRMAILRRKASEPTTILNWLSNYSHKAGHVLQVNYPDPVPHLSTRTGLCTRPRSRELAHLFLIHERKELFKQCVQDIPAICKAKYRHPLIIDREQAVINAIEAKTTTVRDCSVPYLVTTTQVVYLLCYILYFSPSLCTTCGQLQYRYIPHWYNILKQYTCW